jgi:thiamine-monophosphate kinase
VPKPEKALISEIRRMAKSPGVSRIIQTGIGDDCAILRIPPGNDTLVTTDFSLEGVHFRRDWHPPESVGHRCLARGLSDIAAMGGEPVAFFLSLAVPRDLAQSWITRFTRGLLALASKHDVTLAGGDTAESPNGILADIIVFGTVPKGRAILRSGARPGDRIYVTGVLGAAAAAVHQFQAGRGNKPTLRTYARHFYPEPRIEAARLLREKALVTAMIDLSDGLSTDLAHICEESGFGAEIRSAAIPLARAGKPAHSVTFEEALHGGEDYELLFTAPPTKRIPLEIAGVRITQIGEITRSKQIRLVIESGTHRKVKAQGWEHFRK